MHNPPFKKIAIITSSPRTVQVFLIHQIQELSKIYNVTLLTNIDDENYNMINNLPSSVTVLSIPIERNIHIFKDIKALWLLYKLYRSSNFDLIHSVNPKAGLLSVIAGWMARVPNRLHTFTGQVWVTQRGPFRLFLKLLDSLLASKATLIIVDSFSQMNFLIKQNIVRKNKSIVLKKGSISGVDFERFHPNLLQRIKIRKKLGINQDTILIIFVGRLKIDKGVTELVKAFILLLNKGINAEMLIVGQDEDNLKKNLIDELSIHHNKVHFVPFANNPEYYMMSSDIFVLPSYREGFGSVVIEAAACGIPAIVSNIYGLVDAVKNNKTGLVITLKSVNELAEMMAKLALDNELRTRYGKNALKYARKSFSQKNITKAVIDLYASLLQKKNKKVLN